MSTAAPGSRRWARGAAVITVATFLANGLAYVMSVVLSRTLGPSDYGAMAALLSLAVIGSIPQQGEQFLAARSTAPDPDARVSTARAWTAGSALLLVSCLAAPWATSALSLPSLWDLPLLGSMLLPLTVLGCYLGILLGSGRNLAFGALLAGVSAGRLLAALVGVVGGGSVTGFLLLASAATWLALLAAVLVTHGGSTTLRGAWRWGELVAATSAVAAVFIVTNTDVVAARVLLEPGASGDYGVAGLFARVAFWGPYALVLVVFPLAVRGDAGRRPLLVGLAVTWCAGVLLALGAALLAGPFIRITSGPAYENAAGLAPWMALLGTVGATLQLLLMHALAHRSRRVEGVVWTALGVEIVMLALLRPSSAAGIIGVAIAVQAVAAASSFVLESRTTPVEAPR